MKNQVGCHLVKGYEERIQKDKMKTNRFFFFLSQFEYLNCASQRDQEDGMFSSSRTTANLDIFLNFKPYFMKIRGMGKAKQERPPSRLQPGPTPRLLNNGRAASGSPNANRERRKVFPAMALAASGPYESARKFKHC